mgnify:CR=1 FL=1
MDRALYTSMTGAKHNTFAQAVHANNLANVATDGFRRDYVAARSMGAGLWTRITRVILPNIRFGILTALFLTFVLSWEEIGVTLFITSVNAVTLPRLMWMGLRDNIDPAIAAISVVLIVIVVTVILAKTVWQMRKGGRDA